MSINKSLNWHEQAKALFFIEHLKINDIALIVNKRRETVSRFLNKCENYDKEVLYRKKESHKRRKEYQNNWDRENRNRYSKIDGNTIRREHEIAVRVLSGERY